MSKTTHNIQACDPRNLNKFKSLINRLSLRYSVHNVFSDFLDIMIAALAGGRMEEQYFEVIGRYQANELTIFAELFAETVMLMDNNGQGYNDCLGEFFMQEITRGHNGQFFTPPEVCHMMAAMTVNQETRQQTICDPAAGSGRTLLAAAQVSSKNNFFYAADLDIICAKMCAINFCLNGLRGEVAWMDSLKYELFRAYEIYYDPERLYAPTIRLLEKDQSVFYAKREAIIPYQEAQLKTRKNQNPAQLDLFNV